MITGAKVKKTRFESVYTTEEFSRLYGCSIRTTQNMCDQGPENGGIDSYRVGSRGLRIPKTELERLRRETRTAELNYAAPACADGGA
jgi:excisionase family DNA binding protein